MGFWRIHGGKLWKDTQFVPNDELVYELPAENDRVIQLNEEDLILPGMMDMHFHLWAPPAQSIFGMPDTVHYSQGFVGGVDAGTYGYENWATADQYWQNASCLKLKSFVSMQPIGLSVFPPTDPTPLEQIDEQALIRTIASSPNALGVKVQLGFLKYKSPETDELSMEIAKRVKEETGKNMMVHISGQCMDPCLQASYMDKGDIISHLYSGFPNTILNEKGDVYPELWEAKARGVLFDIGHAGKHFSWDVFRKAYHQGFRYDFMGSDLGVGNYRTEAFPIYDQFHILSGFINAGVDLNEAVRAVTTAPADYLGMPLDINETCLILKYFKGETRCGDGLGEYIDCRFEYRPAYFMNQGRLIM